MKLNRTKNTIKSIWAGLVNKILILILPFIVRTIFIRTLGIEYLGLNSLFTSILSVLNIAELGVGSAIIFTMYGAIAKDDDDMICALENYYKHMYRWIGTIIFIIGILIMPFIKNLCSGDIPDDINIYILYILYLINTVLSYFLYSYKTSLLQAFQKVYIINNVNTISKIIMNILQIIFLIMGRNYYTYVIVIILATIIENIINAVIVNKKYPKYKPNGTIATKEKKIISNKIKALFCYKIGGVVLNSVDSIVISKYLGLTILGKYNNYYYVITAIFGFLQIITNAMVAGVGNSIETETIEKNYKDFTKLNFLQSWLIIWCASCLITLYQPFIKLWVGQENCFGFGIVICFVIYFYVWKMMDIINLYKEAAGLWEFDKYRPIVASIVNLIINVILVQKIGLYGIIISTIVSIVFIIFPWSSFILFREYFKGRYSKYLKNYILISIQAMITIVISFTIINKINIENEKVSFILKCILCIVVPNFIFVILNFKNKALNDSVMWISSKFTRRAND